MLPMGKKIIEVIRYIGRFVIKISNHQRLGLEVFGSDHKGCATVNTKHTRLFCKEPTSGYKYVSSIGLTYSRAQSFRRETKHNYEYIT